MKRILFLSLALSVCLCGAARNYFVAAAGDDRGDGSKAHPWQTIRSVNRSVFAAGDSVFFHGGDVFRGGLRLNGVQELYLGSWVDGFACLGVCVP
jgi:hypothetical protein